MSREANDVESPGQLVPHEAVRTSDAPPPPPEVFGPPVPAPPEPKVTEPPPLKPPAPLADPLEPDVPLPPTAT